MTLTVRAGPTVAANRVTGWFSIDGEYHAGDHGTTVEFTPGLVEWDTLIWGYRQVWTAQLPAQPINTLVSYQIAATTADGSIVAATTPTTRPPICLLILSTTNQCRAGCVTR